ncbi:hypothetical protein GGR50DRAFT_678340 [Xylaria sp. CBS 124048]|nr:hypothetical protein GGR50DRAFT_678340 [Xylaria sp. CBS 124048]
MDKSMPEWLQLHRQPYVEKTNVPCQSGHIHPNNLPAAGFVLVKLDSQSRLELLLDLHIDAKEPNTYAFIGGQAMHMMETPLNTATRKAEWQYGITPDQINLLGLQYTRDHGGSKYLSYTYIFAEYSPKHGRAPRPRSMESVKSEWFSVYSLPHNMMEFIVEDGEAIRHVLLSEVWPRLLELRNKGPQMPQMPQMPPAAQLFQQYQRPPTPSASVKQLAPTSSPNVKRPASTMLLDTTQVKRPAPVRSPNVNQPTPSPSPIVKQPTLAPIPIIKPPAPSPSPNAKQSPKQKRQVTFKSTPDENNPTSTSIKANDQ